MILGTGITEEMLASYPENKDKPITKLMLAKAAEEQMGMPDGKDSLFTEGIKHVNGMKEEYGQGASTLILIANQTGEKLKRIDSKGWSGDTWKYPFDREIDNGQISVVLHTKTFMFRGSVGSVIYRLEKTQDEFVLAFWNPYIGENKSFIGAGVKDEWNKKSWDYIYNVLSKSVSSKDMEALSYWGNSDIGASGTSPLCTFTLRRVKE